MIKTYSQLHHTDKYLQHSSVIWPVWLDGSVFVYELTGCSRVATYPRNLQKAPEIEKLPQKMPPKIFELAKSPKIMKKYPPKSPKISTLWLLFQFFKILTY